MEGTSDVDIATELGARTRRRQLAQLFDDEFDAVYRFCLARAGDAAAADDAASEAFVAAARVFAAGRGHEVDRPWLFVTARNRMVDQWRAHERSRQRLKRLMALDRTSNGNQSGADSALADQVIAVLASLPERQRAALTLRHLDELSVAEVAERLDITYQAAESLLARGRRSFATAWEHRRD